MASALVSARPVEQEPETPRVTRRGRRKLLREVRDRLESLEWRLSVLEQRVGTDPDLEWADFPSLSYEVERLRGLLRRHGIDPENGAA